MTDKVKGKKYLYERGGNDQLMKTFTNFKFAALNIDKEIKYKTSI